MIQIRHGIFETNSSSTHSLNICTRQEWNDWKEGKLLYNPYESEFIDNYLLSEEKKQTKLREYYDTKVKKDFYKDFNNLTKEELSKLMMKAIQDKFIFPDLNKLEDNDYFTYDAYWDRNDELEGYSEYYTSKSGDEIVIFGEYGYDG